MQTNFACDLRFSTDTCPHSGHLRLVFCGATATSRPPRHCAFVFKLAAQLERAGVQNGTIQPELCTFFAADLLMSLTRRSSTTTTTWFLLMSFETLSATKSFLMWALSPCNLVIRAFALRQFFENFFLRARRVAVLPTWQELFQRLALVDHFTIRQGWKLANTPVAIRLPMSKGAAVLRPHVRFER